MSLPSTFALTAALLVASAAQAQQAIARERRERSVTLTGDSAEPPHEIRVARGVATTLVFKSRINAEAVEVDTQRARLLAVGEWAIVFEPLVEPGAEGGLLLSVPFTDGQAPSRAVFTLVSSPTEVDSRLEVARLAPTTEAPARCANFTPTRFARDGWLTQNGVVARQSRRCKGTGSAPVCEIPTVYRADTWVLIKVPLSNAPGQPPWAPREVTFKGMQSGAQLKVLSVELVPAKLQPGTHGQLFIEVTPPTGEELFTLEVRDGAGRGFTIEDVDLSMKENKP